MNHDSEIRQLAGETLAIQRLLVELCAGLALVDQRFKLIIKLAFDNAANVLEQQTIAFGAKVPPEHLAHSLRVIEDLRAACIIDSGDPKHRV